MASPDQPPHVPRLLPSAPLLLHLPRPLLPILLLLTCGRVRLPHPLPRLSPAGPVLLPVPQSRHQSESVPRTGHAHPQGGEQSELLPWPGHAHTQSASQSLQLGRLSQLFAEISSHLSFSFIFLTVFHFHPFSSLSECEWHCVGEKQGLRSPVNTGPAGCKH